MSLVTTAARAVATCRQYRQTHHPCPYRKTRNAPYRSRAHHAGFHPAQRCCRPERLIEGAPSFQTWELDTALAEAAEWGQIRTGVWEATPGTTISIKGNTFEFCHILSGRVEIIEDGVTRFLWGR